MARDRLAAMRVTQTVLAPVHPSSPGVGSTTHHTSLSPGSQSPQQSSPLDSDIKEKALELGPFMDQVSDLNDAIKTINDNLLQIRSLQQQSLSELDSDQSSKEASRTTVELVELSARTSSLIRNCKNRIESLQSLIVRSNQPQDGFSVHLTQIGALKKRLMDSIMKYQSVEQEFRQKSQARIERQYRIVKPDATPEEIREVVNNDQSVQIFSQALMTSNRHGDARAAFNEVKERHQQLKRIETTLTELMEMFNDLALMVEEQDQVVQNVETAAVEVEKDMEQAGQQISKARDSAAAARKKRWICFFIIVLLLAIAGAVIAVVVVTNNNKKTA